MLDRQIYFIGYEYQVIIPLMYIRGYNNDDVIEITQYQMLDYRIKCAQEFVFNNIKVEFETGRNGLDSFIEKFGSYVEVLELGDELSYRLKSSFTNLMYNEMLSKLDDSIKNILINNDIIKSSIEERSLS